MSKVKMIEILHYIIWFFFSNDGSDLVNSKDCKLLDVGCGPSIANIISASKLFSHITMADYLTSNRDEVARFKSDAEDAFQWQHYFDFCADLEPNTSLEDIMQRTRNAINVILRSIPNSAK